MLERDFQLRLSLPSDRLCPMVRLTPRQLCHALILRYTGAGKVRAPIRFELVALSVSRRLEYVLWIMKLALSARAGSETDSLVGLDM